jgi:hypothetical protein
MVQDEIERRLALANAKATAAQHGLSVELSNLSESDRSRIYAAAQKYAHSMYEADRVERYGELAQAIEEGRLDAYMADLEGYVRDQTGR